MVGFPKFGRYYKEYILCFDIQSDSHYIDCCLGREKPEHANLLKPKPERYCYNPTSAIFVL